MGKPYMVQLCALFFIAFCIVNYCYFIDPDFYVSKVWGRLGVI